MFSLCCWPDPVVECPDCVEAARAWGASLAVERLLHCCQVLARFIRQSHHRIPQFGKKLRYFSGFS